MEIIAFERGIRCNPPSSFPFESRRRPTEVRGLIYFQSGSTPRFIETHGFPRWRWCCQKPAVEYVLVARKRLPPPLHPSPPNQRGPIFFRQYWPSLYSGRRRGGGGRGPKNSCGFHVARRRNNVDTGRVANPGCSTRRLDYTADLSEALSALSPRTRRPHEIEIYIPAAYPKGEGEGERDSFAGARRIAIEYPPPLVSLSPLCFLFIEEKLRVIREGRVDRMTLIYWRKRDFSYFLVYFLVLR